MIPRLRTSRGPKGGSVGLSFTTVRPERSQARPGRVGPAHAQTFLPSIASYQSPQYRFKPHRQLLTRWQPHTSKSLCLWPGPRRTLSTAPAVSSQAPAATTSSNNIVPERSISEVFALEPAEAEALENLAGLPAGALSAGDEALALHLPAVFQTIFSQHNIAQYHRTDAENATNISGLDALARRVTRAPADPQAFHLLPTTPLQEDLMHFYHSKSLWRRFTSHLGELADGGHLSVIAAILRGHLKEFGPHETARVVNVSLAEMEKEVYLVLRKEAIAYMERQFSAEAIQAASTSEGSIDSQALQDYLNSTTNQESNSIQPKESEAIVESKEEQRIRIELPPKPKAALSLTQTIEVLSLVGSSPSWREERYFDFVVDVLSMDGHLRWSLEATRDAIARLPRVSVTGQFPTDTRIPPTTKSLHPLSIELEESTLLVGQEWMPQELGRLIGTITREEFEIDTFADLLVGLFNIDWASQEGILPATSATDPGPVAPVGLPVEAPEEADGRSAEEVDALFPPEKSPREAIKVEAGNTMFQKRLDELKKEAWEDEGIRAGSLPAQFAPTGQGYRSLSPFFLQKRMPPVWYQYMGYMGIVLAEALSINKHWVDEDIAWSIHLATFEAGRFAMRRWNDYNIEEHILWLSDIISQTAVKYGRFHHDYRLIQIVLNNVVASWPEERHEQLAALITNRMRSRMLPGRVSGSIKSLVAPLRKLFPTGGQGSIIEESIESGESILWIPPPQLKDAVLTVEGRGKHLVKPDPDEESLEMKAHKYVMPKHFKTKQHDDINE